MGGVIWWRRKRDVPSFEQARARPGRDRALALPPGTRRCRASALNHSCHTRTIPKDEPLETGCGHPTVCVFRWVRSPPGETVERAPAHPHARGPIRAAR